MSKNTVTTTSGIEVDAGDVAEWVGLHYGRNFDADSVQKKQEWVDRFADFHDLVPGDTVVKLADGWTLRSGVYEKDAKEALKSGEYVRLCKPDGEEYLFWDQSEWRDDPAIVMGAIMNAAAGFRLEESESVSV